MKNTIAHVAIAVENIDAAKGLFELLSGSDASKPHIVEKQNVNTSFVQIGETSFELLEPFGHYSTPDVTRPFGLAPRWVMVLALWPVLI